MSVELGNVVTVELPEHVTQQYNDQNPANAPVDVGTVRPAVVVGVNEEYETPPNPQLGQREPVVTPRSVNLLILHDGPGTLYVHNVPEDVCTVVGSSQPDESVSQDTPTPQDSSEPQDGGQAENSAKPWNPNREGTGETYQGQGPYPPALQGRYEEGQQNTPAPLQGVPPGQHAAPSSNGPRVDERGDTVWG